MTRTRLFAAAVLCASVLPAQQVRRLDTPDAAFKEPFTSIRGVRELRDGRVIVVDNMDKSVQLIDLARGATTRIGREGSGPGEYALPMRILALPGDSSAVFDMLNSRSLIVLPDGRPGGFLAQPTATQRGPGGGMMMAMQAPPRFSDNRGRLYSAGNGVRLTPDGPVSADSSPILRFDRSSGRTDTVAYIRPPKGNSQVSGGGNRVMMRIGGANPYTPRDEWAVMADGRVVVLRSPEYRVEWVGGTSVTVPYRRIKLTDKHKEQLKQSMKNNIGVMRTVDNGRTETRAVPVPVPEFSDWPEYLPPFVSDAAQPAPNGTVWIARTREANDDRPAYDVIDASGRVTMHVILRPRSRLLGFGNATIYVARSDEDDLEYLERYRMP